MTGNQTMSHCVRPQLLYSHDVDLHLWQDCVEDLKTSVCGHNFPELLLPFHWTSTYMTSVIMGDQIVLHCIQISSD
jgi:hypothetical protein